MRNGDEASPSIIFADQALLVKMLITLEPLGIFVQILYTYVHLSNVLTDHFSNSLPEKTTKDIRLCGSIWPRCTMPGIFVDIYVLKATILNY